VGAKDEQITALTASLEAALAALEGERELRRRLELRVAELERRLSMDSTDSSTPSSKERIGAKEARKARQESERQRRQDRKRGRSPSGSAARTASAAGSPVIRAKAWNGTRTERHADRGSAGGMPFLPRVPGRRGCRGAAVGAGH